MNPSGWKLRRAAFTLMTVCALMTIAVASSSCRGGGGVPADIFAMALGSDPETFDPGVMSGSVEGRVAYNIYEGLVSPPPDDGPPRPGVAERWEVSPDGLTYTFYLRSNALWSNGDPVTADDFVYAWMRMLRHDVAAEYINFVRYLKNARAFEEAIIAGQEPQVEVGVRSQGPQILVVELEEPVPYFIDIVMFYTMFPVHRASIERHGQEAAFAPENIVTNGAFRLAEYRIQNAVKLRKNERYWDADSVRLRGIDMLIIENLSAQVAAFDDGRIDWTYDPPDDQLAILATRDEFRVAPQLGTYYYRFNVTRPPLDDVRVRRALSLAVNRANLCRCTLDGKMPATAHVAPMPGYTSPTGLVEYDPREARRLLAEAGYPGGRGFPRIEILYNTSENHRTVAQAIQDMWQLELNIDVGLNNQEWRVYLETMNQLDYHVARAGWIGDYVDPNTFLEMWRGDDQNNDTGFANPEYDRLIDAGFAETDPAARERILQEAETLLLTEMPVMPVYYYAQEHLVRTSVRGWEMNVRDVHLGKYIWKE